MICRIGRLCQDCFLGHLEADCLRHRRGLVWLAAPDLAVNPSGTIERIAPKVMLTGQGRPGVRGLERAPGEREQGAAQWIMRKDVDSMNALWKV